MNCRFAYRFDHLAPNVATAEKLRRRRSRLDVFDFAILSPHRLGRSITARWEQGRLSIGSHVGHEPVSLECSLEADLNLSASAVVTKLARGLDRLFIAHDPSRRGDADLGFVRWIERCQTSRGSYLSAWDFVSPDWDVWHAVADEAERRWHQRWQGEPR